MPDALILGDIAHTDMDYFRKGQFKYMSPPELSKVHPEFTLARKNLNKFFQQEIDLSEFIHFETDKMYGLIDDMDP